MGGSFQGWRSELASRIQAAVPLEPDPFASLGASLGVSGGQVIGALRRWRSEGLLREISGALDGALLDHDSALVALRAPAGRVDGIAAVVGAHPMVSHLYLRDDAWNLWFTLSVPRSTGLERHLAALGCEAGTGGFAVLRRRRTFKLAVSFQAGSLCNHSQANRPRVPSGPAVLSARERSVLAALQRPMPLRGAPFGEAAASAGTSVAELLGIARSRLGGVLRRFAGTFNHRRMGVRGNAMAVWSVSSSEAARAGSLLAACPEVSHCYEREPAAGWPYTLYAMLHGPDQAAVRRVARRVGRHAGLPPPRLLFSLREFKKCRLRYFQPELDAWWSARRGLA